MDPPLVNDGGTEREKFEEVKDGGPMHHCNLFDTEVTRKIAQAFLPGLASACVDNTTGGLFRTPGSVTVEIRKEMVDFLIQKSETFVAEAVVLEGGAESEVPDHPYDIISDFIDDFASSKRNFFSRVSSWVLSDRREDRIDDFVQEMELNGFWLIGRREAVAQTLLKNVDFKDAFHCNKKFNTAEELAEHLPQCSFRTIDCQNEGCDGQFTAGNTELHDSVCPFKILPCEQNCSETLLRREMDRHCITVCPMKLVNCPFYSVGCQSTVPRSMLEQHKKENVHSHILCILQGIHKEATTEDLKHRVEQLEKLSSPGELGRARDARSLTSMIKKLEAKFGPLEVSVKPKTNESEVITSQKQESADSHVKKEERSDLPNRKEGHAESPSKNESIQSSTKNGGSIESPTSRKELLDSPAKSEDCSLNSVTKTEDPMDSKNESNNAESPKEEQSIVSPAAEKELSDPLPTKKDNSESTIKKEEHTELPLEKNESMSSFTKNEEHVNSLENERKDSPSNKEERSRSPVEREEHRDELRGSFTKSEEHVDSFNKEDNSKDSPNNKEEPTMSHVNSTTKTDENNDSPSKMEELKGSPVKRDEHKESIINGEGHGESPDKGGKGSQEDES